MGSGVDRLFVLLSRGTPRGPKPASMDEGKAVHHLHQCLPCGGGDAKHQDQQSGTGRNIKDLTCALRFKSPPHWNTGHKPKLKLAPKYRMVGTFSARYRELKREVGRDRINILVGWLQSSVALAPIRIYLGSSCTLKSCNMNWTSKYLLTRF